MEVYKGRTADDLKQRVCAELKALGLKYHLEQYSPIKSCIIGKDRRVDVTVIDGNENPLLHIECKHQRVSGTTEDKLFRAVTEANRDKTLGIPSIIVFSGFGWTPSDMRHAMLNGAVRIELLRDWMRIYFRYTKLDPSSVTRSSH